MQRLFFALWPDEVVRRELIRVQQRLQVAGSRPVQAQNFHLTLVFLGPIAPGTQQAVEAEVANVRLPGFVLTLDSAGWWRGPRITWLAAQHTPEPLTSLHNALQRGCKRHTAVEMRPFKPHVTMVRKVTAELNRHDSFSIPWQVTEFCLVESITDSDGVIYRVIKRWPLDT